MVVDWILTWERFNSSKIYVEFWVMSVKLDEKRAKYLNTTFNLPTLLCSKKSVAACKNLLNKKKKKS